MSGDFAKVMEPVARHLLGEPNKALSSETELRFGSHGSLSIDLTKGTWFDFEANGGGGVLDLVRRELGHVNGAAIDWLKSEGFLTDDLQPESRRVVAAYPYHDESGELLFEVLRYEPKDFRQRRPDGKGDWTWQVKGVRRVPYRLPEVLACGEVWIVEGEKDADRLAGLGVVATSSPGGACKWKPELNEHFTGKQVMIVPDCDEPGRRHGEHVAASLHGVAESIRVVTLPHGKDVSDFLDAGGTKDDLIRLAIAAPLWSPAEQQTRAAGDETNGEALLGMTFPEIKFVVPGYLPEGFAILGGRPKVGKSWLSLDWAVAVASGGCALGSVDCEAGDVLYLGLEDNLRRLQSRLREIVDAMPIRPRLDRLTFRTVAPRLDDGLLDVLEAWRSRVERPSLVVLDVLAKVRPSRDRGEDVYSYDYRCVAPLQQWASTNRLSVLAPHHVRKLEAEDPLEMLSGSNGLSGAADTVIVLTRSANGLALYGRGRDIEEFETIVERTGGTWRIIGDAAEVAKSSERRAILDALAEAEGPIGPSDIAEATGMKSGNVRFLLSKMAKAGEVSRAGHGRYTLANTANIANISS